MPSSRVICYLCAAMLSLVSAMSAAEEVTLQHDGRTLNADLTLAPGKQLADRLLLITHGALAHRDMEMISYLRRLFRDRGYNTLAINLSLGLDNRHGMYDCQQPHRHRNDDAVAEIGAWLDWLIKQGATQVTLLGHSRGGAQTALFAAERDRALVESVVLLAPAVQENTDAAAYQRRYNQPLGPVLARAQQLVEAGQGDTVLEHLGLMTCRDTPVSAASFVSYYGQDPHLDTPYLIPRIRKPLLVVVAGNDEAVVGLDRKVAPLADGVRVQLKTIAGADHMFRDLYSDDAVDLIDAFLQGGG